MESVRTGQERMWLDRQEQWYTRRLDALRVKVRVYSVLLCFMHRWNVLLTQFVTTWLKHHASLLAFPLLRRVPLWERSCTFLILISTEILAIHILSAILSLRMCPLCTWFYHMSKYEAFKLPIIASFDVHLLFILTAFCYHGRAICYGCPICICSLC